MEVYLVGGAVRDQLLQFPYTERDWVVVGATSDDLLTQGFQPVGKDFPVFLHPDSKEEYALARTERKNGSGYTGFDCFSSPDVTLEEDLLRRDLTINAMAQDDTGHIIDPYHGQQDLEKKVLRHVSEAFIEDPLRVLRVARFHARYAHLGFSVAPETLQLMRDIAHSGELATLSAERIWKELERSLNEHSAQCFIKTLAAVDAVKTLFPEWLNLNDSILAGIERFSTHQPNNLYNFAMLCSELSEQAFSTLCKRIRAPNSFCEFAELINRYGEKFKQSSTDSHELLQRLESLDAFRRKDRFQQFCDYCKTIYIDTNSIDQLERALSLCETVSAHQFVTQGFKGKAIGHAINEQRIQMLEDLV